MRAIAPAGTGTVNVRVITIGESSPATTADQFTYLAAPTVCGISPGSGGLGETTGATITGTSFTDGNGASLVTSVTVGGVAATAINVTSATQMTVTIPATTTPGDKSVVVTASLGASNAPVAYRNYAPATISAAFSPASVPFGSSNSGASTLTFTLTNPSGNPGKLSNVAFSYSYAAAQQTYRDVRTTCNGGRVSELRSTFSLVPSTERDSQSRPGAFLLPGESCTLSGTFYTTRRGEMTVVSGGVKATGDRSPNAGDSSTEQTFTSNTGARATLTAGGPTVTSVSPSAGPAGTSVTITGSGFFDFAYGVRFGAQSATYMVNSDTQVTAIAPAGNSGTVDVSFSDFYGSGTLPAAFTYQLAAPVVTAPANGAVRGSRPTYSGTAPVGSTVTIYVDGGAIGTVVATDGNWSLTPTTALAYGTHTVYATDTLDGATSANSTTNSFTAAQTAAPVVTAPANNAAVATATPT